LRLNVDFVHVASVLFPNRNRVPHAVLLEMLRCNSDARHFTLTCRSSQPAPPAPASQGVEDEQRLRGALLSPWVQTPSVSAVASWSARPSRGTHEKVPTYSMRLLLQVRRYAHTLSEIKNPARLRMLKLARYSAVPHATARTHKVPIAVIEELTGKREQDALDGKRCLFELLIVTRSDQPTQMPPVLVAPSSGGEVRFGKKLLPDYPEEFAPGEYLVVTITML
jgi:hypothetical protein